MSKQQTQTECSLCQTLLSLHSIVDGHHRFCCSGCHAVFNILLAKNELEGCFSHPLFLQALRSGVISNPALLDHIEKQRAELGEGERQKLYFEVDNLWCPSCADVIKLMLLKERGVLNCVVDYATDLAAVEFSPRHISKEQLIAIVRQLGYEVHLLDAPERKAVSFSLYLRFGIAAFCALNAMMFAYPLYATYFDAEAGNYGLLFAWLSLFVSLPVITYSAWPIWRRFWLSLKTGFFGMETLVAIGVTAAMGVSVPELLSGGTHVYFDSMTVIIAFVLLGKIVEAKAKFSAKASLIHLARSTPRRGRKRFADGTEAFVLVKELTKGDLLVGCPGEKIAIDGVVVEGEGACDESLMTGEAMPVSKKSGSSVLAGTLISHGYLVYRVTSNLEETALHKIIEIVEGDIEHKSSYVRAADLVVKWFVPAVIALAAMTALLYLYIPGGSDLHPFNTALQRALAVLLISCPCAIGIAAPVAEAHLMNRLAACGVIVRNRGCIPYLGSETTVVFDKTGTVTEGRFRVLRGLDLLSEEERGVIGCLAALSTHPIAVAIAQACSPTKRLAIANMQEIAGCGVMGDSNGTRYMLGSARFLQQHAVDIPINEVVEEGESCVYIAKKNQYLAVLVLGDRIRPEVKDVIEELNKSAKTVLLSGDGKQAVDSVARFCGFDSWYAGCSPIEKRSFVDQLKKQGEVVCMLGDGINDAPALTAAHVGLSVVSAADMSIQVSDLLLTTDRLEVLGKIRTLGQKGQKVIKQNLFWAFFFNVIGIFLAVVGLLSPIFAAFAMSASSIIVLLNARRIDRIGKI